MSPPGNKRPKVRLKMIGDVPADWNPRPGLPGPTRASCPPDRERHPCEYVLCRHHNFLERLPEEMPGRRHADGLLPRGILRFRPGVPGCSLDVAATGAKSADVVSRLIGLSGGANRAQRSRRIQGIVDAALAKLGGDARVIAAARAQGFSTDEQADRRQVLDREGARSRTAEVNSAQPDDGAKTIPSVQPTPIDLRITMIVVSGGRSMEIELSNDTSRCVLRLMRQGPWVCKDAARQIAHTLEMP